MTLAWTAALATITFAAHTDWRTRRVVNAYWIPGLIIAGLLLTIEMIHGGQAATWTSWHPAITRLLAGTVTAGVAGALWYTGHLGGADAKATIMIGALLSPTGYWSPTDGQFIPALDALLPALIIAEIWRRHANVQSTPFLVSYGACLWATAAIGNLLAWPVIIWH